MHAPASDFWTDAGTCNATVKRLKDNSFPLKHYVVVRAGKANTKDICVGNSDAVNTGLRLSAGEQTPPIPIDNLDKLWVVSTDGDQGYSWIAM
jgi:hypothetical protein